LPAVVPVTIPRLAAARADWAVLGFALLVAMVNGLLFGIVPALRAVGLRGQSGPRDRVRSSLIAAQVAVAMILVILGGQLLASFVRLMRTDPGFAMEGLVASVIVPAGEQYRAPGKQAELFRHILESVLAIPGVESAGTVDALPFSGENHGGFVSTTEAAIVNPSGQEIAEVDVVSSEYLQAMGARLMEGRWFQPEEMGDQSEVAIVGDVAARHFWPGRSAIGQQICVSCERGKPRNWKRVVGVVSSMHHVSLEGSPGWSVYVAQKALDSGQFLLVRTSRPEGEMALAIRRAVAAIDPNQPVFLTASLSSFVADSIADRRFIMSLLAGLAVLALAMSAAGVYGVIAYATSRRTREIGVRMAVGATPRRIHVLIFQQGFWAVGAGLLTGLTVSLVLLRWLRGVLTGLEFNPAQVLVAGAVVTLAAAVACWVPSRRASRLDPMASLRCE